MVLRKVCALLCLVALATAQTAMMPEVTPSPTPGAMVTADDDLDARYEDSLSAQTLRRRHFYCLDVNQTRADFPESRPSGNADEVEPYVWAIFLQFPVLSYLDSHRKVSLFRNIAALVQEGAEIGSADGSLANFEYTDFCIANVFHYDVSGYDESVLINVFFRNGSLVFNQESMDGMGPSIADFDMAFQNGYNQAVREQNRDFVDEFEGRNALVVNPVMFTSPDDPGTETERNSHPGVVSFGDDTARDPTRRAILINTFRQATTLEQALESDFLQQFADNPNPTNFGLEAGDIVFAVFGSIFLTILMGVTVLGFCIHPFFLA